MDLESRYDVVIVGGRPAGASLAARLGARGVTVLVVDKAEFPSLPEVPSCPTLFASGIRLLDEIGFTEPAYSTAVTKLRAAVLGFEGHYHVRFGVPEAFGRDYFYGIDRERFDAALWTHLERFPSVARRAGFAVNQLLRDATGRVIGIEGSSPGGPVERIGARLAVVGADGRHSLVARRAGAEILEDRADHTSTVHFADWEGLAPALPTGEPVVQIVATGRGANALFFPSRPGRTAVVTYVRTDRAETGGDAQAYYLARLSSLPTVRARLAGARQVSPLLGLRKIANRYRTHGGPGWVLVGDALHHKDPVDGQGIYDALIEAKHLADLLVAHRDGALTWAALLDRYHAAARAETHEMFQATMKRLQQELYSEPPKLVIRTLLRWAFHDPEYHRRFFLYLARTLPPADLLGPRFMASIAARGLARDVLHLISPRRRAASLQTPP